MAAITGPPSPYTVHWKTPLLSDEPGPWPEITHSCTASDGSFADPSIRTTAFVNEFGANGLLLPICEDDFAPALHRIADKIIGFTKPCLGGTVAKRPGTSTDDCQVVATTPDGRGDFASNAVAACADTGGAGPCWQLTPGEAVLAGSSLRESPSPEGSQVPWLYAHDGAGLARQLEKLGVLPPDRSPQKTV